MTLVRHAEAAGGFGSDRARRLTDAGLTQASRLAAALADVIAPQVICHSSATRTTQTAARLAGTLGVTDLRSEHTLYDAWWDDVLAYLRGLEDDVTDVIVVGHQPTIGATAAALCSDPSLSHAATASAAVMTFTGSWLDLAEGGCALAGRYRAEPR